MHVDDGLKAQFNSALSKTYSILSSNYDPSSLYVADPSRMNQIFSGNQKLDTYIYIGLPSDGSVCVLFKPFITNFSRNVKTKTTVNNGSAQSIQSTVIQGGSTISAPEFLIEFDIVANDLVEAKQNAAKIQLLSRMFLKRSVSSEAALKDGALEGLYFPGYTADIARQELMVYVPSMIERPKQSYNEVLPYTQDDMYNNSVNLFLKDYSFEIDMDLGFLEDGSKIFPKAYKMSLNFKNTDANLIRPYKIKGAVSREYVIVDPKKKPGGAKEATLTKDNAYLFPFNRKTVKIGGR